MKPKFIWTLLTSLSAILAMGSELPEFGFLEMLASPACLLLCVVTALFLAASVVHADTPFVIVVTNGTPVPEGNGTINLNQSTSPNVVGAFINDAGQVAFETFVTTNNCPNCSRGIYRWDATPGNLTNIVRQGQSAPDGNGSFDEVLQQGSANALIPPTLNGAGQVAFWASLANTVGGTNNSGLFRWTAGVITQIVRTGWACPDGNGRYNIPVVNNTSGSLPLNSTGQVAFYSALTGSTNGSTQGLFRGNGTTLTQIARSGYSSSPFGTFGNLGSPALNDSGQLAFINSPGANSNLGIYRSDGATLTQIAHYGELAPDGNGILHYDGLSDPAINNSGQVGFRDDLYNNVTGGWGIFRGDGITLSQIVRSDQLVPDGNGSFGSWPTPLFMNNAGQIVFSTSISGTVGGTNQTGIYRGDGVTLKKIARQGERAPDSSTTFGNVYASGGVAINDSGQVAFLAPLSGGGTGIYFYADHMGLLKVIRTGDSLLGTNVTALRFDAYWKLGNEGSGLNNRGQVVFSFGLSGSPTYGIAVWSAPEVRITDIRTVTNDVRLTWNTIAGKTNVVQATPGGPGGSYTNNFTDLSGNIVVSGVGQVNTNYLDTGGATNRPARYYRVRLVP